MVSMTDAGGFLDGLLTNPGVPKYYSERYKKPRQPHGKTAPTVAPESQQLQHERQRLLEFIERGRNVAQKKQNQEAQEG